MNLSYLKNTEAMLAVVLANTPSVDIVFVDTGTEYKGGGTDAN